jgi:hypothetical protein
MLRFDGASITDLAEYLRHHDRAVTLRIYGHLQPNSHEKARKIIDARMFRPRAVAGGRAAPSDHGTYTEHGYSEDPMSRLLIVHHTPSPAMQAMFEAVTAGAGHEDIEGVQVVIAPALSAGAADVLAADGYLLGTPANIGYMSGALKHFFDTIYYPCLEATQRRPYGLYVHGASDTGGAVRAVEAIATGLKWRRGRPPVCVVGAPGRGDLDACRELGATIAAELSG